MKKTFLCIVLILSIIYLCACSGKKQIDTDEPLTEVNNSIVNTSESMETLSPVENNNTLLGGTYRIANGVYLDVPDYEKKELGYTGLFVVFKDYYETQRYIAITKDDDTKVEALEEAHNVVFEVFKNNIQKYSYVNSLNIESESKENINGIDVYRYEGTLNRGHDTVYDAYVVGYSFIYNGIPCNITGSVDDEAQDQADIDEIREIVDAMIQTVRSEE